jgi:hypothetical protein
MLAVTTDVTCGPEGPVLDIVVLIKCAVSPDRPSRMRAHNDLRTFDAEERSRLS